MIISRPFQYSDNKTTFEGHIAWDDRITGKKPGVLVAPSFRGQSVFENEKAEALAALGYVGFAIDIYGKGIRARNPEEAQQLMDGLNNNRSLLLQRMELAFDVLREQQEVDETKVGAIGFCFGGKCILDLARSGADLAGTAIFHGVYDPPNIPHEGPIKSPILVLHGWEDPLATPEDTVLLAKELTQRQADWQLHAFGQTGHAFTNPNANFPEKGMFYQESSDKRAWGLMKNFFEEVFC